MIAEVDVNIYVREQMRTLEALVLMYSKWFRVKISTNTIKRLKWVYDDSVE